MSRHPGSTRSCKSEFQQLIRETAADGRTVFLSSHELDEVQRLADRVAIIKEGKLIVTDTVDGLRRAAPRTIEFRFAGDVDPSRFSAIEGVHVTSTGTGRIILTLHGPVAPVLRAAAELDPIDIIARPADLDELFLAYYRGTPAQEPADAR